MKRSLEHQLSVWLSVVIVLIALVAGLLSFASAFHEANEMQDDQLRQLASLIGAQRINVEEQGLEFGPESEPDSRLIVQSLGWRDKPYSAVRPKPALPTDLPDGIQTISVHGEDWRVFVDTSPSGARIAIGQRTELRDDIAEESSLRTVLPLMILIPILVILVGVLVRRTFRPLARLSSCVDAREDNDLTPLADEHAPGEIRPFVASINRLLVRVSRSIEEQQRFVADAAHELRSPITALCLQAENLNRTDISPNARARLAVLRQGLDRARALLEQLLALARSRSEPTPSPAKASLQAIVRSVLEEFIPLAVAKGLDLGVDRDEPAMVEACELDMVTVIRNLVDNAIRCTPVGGRIDVRVYSARGRSIIEVEDSGPGIPEEERLKVFQPFYRILGSTEQGAGLGLSIVENIVSRLKGSVKLGGAHKGPPEGLCLVIDLPSAD